MNRVTRTLVVIMALALIIALSAQVLAEAVFDVDDHWAEDAIHNLADEGIIRPYLDGTFQPDEHITRAEFAKWVVKAFNLSLSALVTFPDTKEHLAKNYIGGLAKAGIIDRKAKSFRPDDDITREEAVDIIAKVIGVNEAEDFVNEDSPFKDLTRKDSVYTSAASLNRLGILSPELKNEFEGKESLTRAEAAYMLEAARRLRLVAGEVSGVDAKGRVITLADGAGYFVVPNETVIIRNDLAAEIKHIEKGDEIRVLVDSTGTPVLVRAKGLITRNDLLGRASELTRGLITAAQVEKIVSQDWQGLQNDLKEFAFNEIVESGAKPWEAQAIISRDWTTLRGIAKERAIEAASKQFNLSSGLVGSIVDQDWDQLKNQLAQMELSEALLQNLNM